MAMAESGEGSAKPKIFSRMRLWERPDQFVLQPDTDHPLLSINRANGEASLISELPLASNEQEVKTCTVYGVLGAIRLLSGTYVLVITGKDCVGSYRNAPVFKVTAMQVLHCEYGFQHLSSSKKKEEAYLVDLLKFVIKTPGLLFSYEVDLTNNAQLSHNLRSVHQNQPLWKQADPRFVWNSYLMEFLLESKAENYILPVIQGSFQTMQVLVGERLLYITLIARRCTRRIGTRMWRRGADVEGSVANFVETEQILEVDGYLASYTQVRGSIPVFWEQIVDLTYKPIIKAVDHEETSKVTERHFRDLSQRYSSILAVDLINQQGSEGVLSVAYRNAMEKLGSDIIRYVPFDFHRICGQIHFERLSSLHDQIAEHLLRQKFFLVNPMGEIVEEQKGVVRTNCIDCLDRTNVTQSLLGRRSMEEELRRIGLFKSAETINDHPVFDTQFNMLWANHGDDISIQYSGTSALKGDFVRYGRRTIAGLLQDGVYSLARYYLNNFQDGLRQDAMDLVAGHYKASHDGFMYQPGIATYLPFVAALIVACISGTTLSLWRVCQGQERVLYTILWATLTASVGAAMRMNGRHFCCRPRLKRLN